MQLRPDFNLFSREHSEHFSQEIYCGQRLGLVERPGSIEGGDVSRYSYIRRYPSLSELSIFIDESGDFWPYDFRSPYYIITMVFHDQVVDISLDFFCIFR